MRKTLWILTVALSAVLMGCDQRSDNDNRREFGQVPCWNNGYYSSSCRGLYAYSGYDSSYWRPYSYWEYQGQQYYTPAYYSGWQSYYSAAYGPGYSAAYQTTAWSNPYGFYGCSQYAGYAPVYLQYGVACYYVGTNQNVWNRYYWYSVGSNYWYGGYQGLLYGCSADTRCPSGLSCSAGYGSSIGVCTY